MKTQRPLVLAACATLLAILSLAAVAAAADDLSTADLLARVQEQQRLIEEQAKRLAEQGEEIAEQNRQIEAMNATLRELARKVQEEADQSAQSRVPATPPVVEERLSAPEREAEQNPDLPKELMEDANFPGSIGIPGRRERFKIGGLVRASAISTFQPLGSDDRFLTYTIPVGEVTTGQTTQFQTSVRPSRLNFDFRTPTSDRPLRAFIEGDFDASGGNAYFRLRHAYIQWSDFLAGQTWSTFSDPEATPEVLDFEGNNARNYLRQTQLRWTPRVGPFSRLAIAIEDADASITGGTGANRWPDLIAGRRWTREAGHFFLALSLRDIRGQWTTDPSVFGEALGWGVTAAGAHSTPFWRAGDQWLYQVTFGQGSARYINDLNGLGGQDAVFDAAGKLHLLSAGGTYLAYEHHWTSWHWVGNIRSTGVVGFVLVNNLAIQPTSAYRRTERFSVNLIGSPLPALDIGLELIGGRRVNKDGESGTATQLQFMAQYRF